jgi:hypothetical protein
MKLPTLLFSGGVVIFGCSPVSLKPPWMQNDWKCVVRDSNGNLFSGIDSTKDTAIERARFQCVSGSPYKMSCQDQPPDCEQLK